MTAVTSKVKPPGCNIVSDPGKVAIGLSVGNNNIERVYGIRS